MIAKFKAVGNWLTQLSSLKSKAGAWPRPNLTQLARAETELPAFVKESSLARHYLTLLGPLDWDHFPERATQRAWPGPKPLPRAPFVAAYLVKLDQGLTYMADLHQFLLDHPALIWLLGFEVQLSPRFSWSFDPQASLPPVRLFRLILRTLPNSSLQFLLDSTVRLIRQELPADPPFGQVIAGDTKHILAWVKENNPKVFMKNAQRYDKNRQPKADPTCKLGCKKRTNQLKGGTTPAANPQPARTVSVGEYYWGYASGLIATKVPDWGEFVLAELTQTFDRPDLSFFYPLMTQTERRLGFKPKFGAFDAGFEAFYTFDYFDQAGGFAAIPLSQRGGVKREFDAAGLPLCAAGLGMPLKSTFLNKRGLVPQRMGCYVCPLRFPDRTDQTCPLNHKNWPKGGCVTKMGLSNEPGCAISLTVTVTLTKKSTTSARPPNGSTPWPSTWASNDPSSVTSGPSPIRTPSSMSYSICAPCNACAS